MKKQIISILICMLFLLSILPVVPGPFGDPEEQPFDEPLQGIPVPEMDGFQWETLSFSDMNVTWLDTGDTGWTNGADVPCVRLTNSYTNITLSTHQLFVPDSIPTSLVPGAGAFIQYRLEEWSGGDMARIQYNLQYAPYYFFDYPTDDLDALLGNKPGTSSSYPVDLFQTGSMETQAWYDSDNKRAFNVTSLVDSETGFETSWTIHVYCENTSLMIRYDLWYHNSTTSDLVHTFIDSYSVPSPPIGDTFTLTSSNESIHLNALVSRDTPNIQLVAPDNHTNITVGLDMVPTGWNIQQNIFTQTIGDGSVSFYPCIVNNMGCLEFLLNLSEQPSSNEIIFNISLNGLQVNRTSNGSLNLVRVFTPPPSSFGVQAHNTTFFTIFRPIIVDSENNSVYANISIVDGHLILSIPQSFLNDAIYPLSVDPTFGYSGTDNSAYIINTYTTILLGSYAAPISGGTADSISVYVDYVAGVESFNIHCALYEYIDHSSDGAGSLIAVTEAKNVSSYDVVYAFNFSEPKPSLTAATNYYMVVTTTSSQGGSGKYLRLEAGTGSTEIYKTGAYGSFDDPLTGESVIDKDIYIFCTYTEGGGWTNTDPVLSGEHPTNASTSISLSPVVGCTVTDSTDTNQTFNVTFASNYSNGVDWVNYQTNQSVSNPGQVNWSFSAASDYGTSYFWKVFCHDGVSNISSDFYFTTENEPLSNPNNPPVQSNPYPSNGTSNSEVSPVCRVTISDPNGDVMNVSFWDNVSHYDDLGYSGALDIEQGSEGGIFDIHAGLFYTQYGGVANNISAWLKPNDERQILCAVYNESHNLLGYTQTLNCGNTVGQWYTFNFTTNITIEPGFYHIALLGNDYFKYGRTNSGGLGVHDDIDGTRVWGDGFPSVFSNESTIDADARMLATVCFKTGNWSLRQTNSSISNGTYYWQYENASEINTTYYWRVTLDDGQNYTNETYHFSTFSGYPVVNSVDPVNGSTGIQTQPTVTVNISHPSSLPMNVSFFDNTSTSYDIGYTGVTPHSQAINEIFGPMGPNITTPSTSVEIDSITVKLNNSANSGMMALIYQDDDQLVTNAVSEIKNINTNGEIEWHTFNFSTKPVLSPSTTYYFCIFVENSTTIYYDDIYPGGYYIKAGDVETFPTYPTDWNSWVFGNGCKMAIYATYTIGGDWQHRQTNHSVYDGEYTWQYTNSTLGDHTYYWKVNITDGRTNITEIYHFSTSNHAPTISDQYPSNNSLSVPYNQYNVSVYINDSDGHTMNWNIDVSNGDTSSGSTTDATVECVLSTLDTETTYTWWVNITDGYTWTNRSYQFTTQDNFPPELGPITASPSVVGYGYNVTINATAWDNESGSLTLKCEITYPDSTTYNFTIDYVSGDDWTKEINLTDTWQLGLHNFTVWATDGTATNTSSTYNFTVYSNVNVSVQTTEDIFNQAEYVNVTDPPTQCENIQLSFNNYELTPTMTSEGIFSYLTAQDTFIDQELGTPMLPKYHAQIVPYRYHQIESINVLINDVEVIPLAYPLYPTQEIVPSNQKANFSYNSTSYEKTGNIINSLFTSGNVSYMHGFPIQSIIIHPFDYNPTENLLYIYKEITIQITYSDFTEYPLNKFFKNTKEKREIISSFVDNPETAKDYVNYDPILPLDDYLPFEYNDGLCDPTDNGGNGYDYVLITSDALNSTSGTYTWQDLIDFREAEGYDTFKITVETIYSCSDYWNSTPRFNDSAAKVREFIKDAYQDWGIEYVLLGGSWTTENVSRRHVPVRYLWSEYGSWLYYAYGNYPSDMYYSNLDGDWWDSTTNGSGCWGGDNAPNQAHKDALSEIKVGRILAYNDTSLSNAVRKTLLYNEITDNDFLGRIAFLGTDLGWAVTSGEYNEEIRDGSSNYGTDGILQWNTSNPEYTLSVNWTCQEDGDSMVPVYTDIDTDNVHIANHVGHGSVLSGMGISTNQWLVRTNTLPMFGYSQACHSGRFTFYNTNTYYLTVFFEEMGFFATIQNTGFGWGSYLSPSGPNQRMNCHFWDYLVNKPLSDWQIGDAFAASKDSLGPSSSGYVNSGGWYGSTLFGDPAQKLRIFGGIYNNKPDISNESTIDHSTDVSVDLSELSISISDTEGDLMNWTIELTNGDSNSSNGISNSTISLSIVSGLEYNTTYLWYVNVTDGGNWTNETYQFTTELSYTESKLDNLGAYNSKGYLIMSIEHNNSGTWTKIEDTINDSTAREILSGQHVKLDSIFNGNVYTSTNLTSDEGQYRVNVSFCDPYGNVLQNTDGTYQNASYTFEYTIDTEPPEIVNVSVNPEPVPYGQDTVITATMWDNETGLIDPVYCHVFYPDGYNYNFTMLPPTFSSGEPYNVTINLSSTLQTGVHYFHIWATDGTNANTTGNYSFEVLSSTIITNVTPSTWNIGSIPTGSQQLQNFTFYQNGTANLDVTITVNSTNFTFVNYTNWLTLGHNQYCANYTNNSWSTEYKIVPGYPSSSVLMGNMAPGNFTFGVRMLVPRSVSYTNTREDFTIVLTVAEAT